MVFCRVSLLLIFGEFSRNDAPYNRNFSKPSECTVIFLQRDAMCSSAAEALGTDGIQAMARQLFGLYACKSAWPARFLELFLAKTSVSHVSLLSRIFLNTTSATA